MSKYTTELRYVVESGYNLGMKDYPIFSENYRAGLNKKILDHFYFNEIGFETVEMFKFYLNTTLKEIMPYYNKLYQSELLNVNPLLSFQRNSTQNKTNDTKKEINKNIDNTKNSNSESSGNLKNNGFASTNNEIKDNATSNTESIQNQSSNDTETSNKKLKDIHSEFPQSLITDNNLEDGFYATDGRITKDDFNNTKLNNVSGDSKTQDTIEKTNKSTGTQATEEESTTKNKLTDTSNENQSEKATDETTVNESFVVTEQGYEIPLADLLIKYRDTFLNVDMMIINDLKNLFMMVY